DPPGLDPEACPAWDAATATPFCTLVEWHRRERTSLVQAGAVDDLSAGATVPLVYVRRPPDTDRLVDVDAYRPGADLLVADAEVDARGVLGTVTPRGSLLGACPGAADARDVRHPDVDYDGSRVVFAMRTA